MADIKFQVVRPNEPDETSPYISLADPTNDIANLRDAEEVVINESSIRVIADYPLKDEFEFEVKPFDGAQHFTRAALAHAISALYQRIYTEEDRTSPEVAGHVPGMMNRDTTEVKSSRHSMLK
ncbi:hypothetical protein KFL_001390260 [Klebsormidium nitens]|uniref:Uncharacterized protein n=1 Tax=Klebsormidium nitens TaxID=105231 RepID=A0A1Y1I507_KLENI|nr:hypothetical protein KFL_001390260 [Klebsormidium nitens]|eukprot:GAQ83208.1 hypothetical protein KFL_001390260 [Klebsormidium nitens]